MTWGLSKPDDPGAPGSDTKAGHLVRRSHRDRKRPQSMDHRGKRAPMGPFRAVATRCCHGRGGHGPCGRSIAHGAGPGCRTPADPRGCLAQAGRTVDVDIGPHGVTGAGLDVPRPGRRRKSDRGVARTGCRDGALRSVGATVGHDVGLGGTGKARPDKDFLRGGSALAASLLADGLVDRLAGITAGFAMGAEGLPGIGALGLDRLDGAQRFDLVEQRALGSDVLHVWIARSPPGVLES